ncbi:MAG: hypothetical protein GF317_07010 [Candidatus Lokiarchaeota archaeon]|nr:hypothetical protein [Candidatus Lokiarchaeota archaeon]MBD3199458.1 hypothetical protein [Candidatus Lokiarchaeota archaeon]
MNYTRNELLTAEATMNQMRNAIYHLARFMKRNNVQDIKIRLRIMGKNIARTYIEYWKPVNLINLDNIREFIATLYKNILNSNVSVELNEIDKLLIVHDTNCALCKYDYDDIDIAGCEILLGLVSEYINLINGTSRQSTILTTEPVKVQESKTYGNNSCVHIFKYNIGEGS